MALAFTLTSVAVSGTNVEVVEHDFRGVGPVRLTVKNTGGQALSACSVQNRPYTEGPAAVIDSTTFATLGAGATAGLVIAEPVERLRILASCAAGTTLAVSVNTPVD